MMLNKIETILIVGLGSIGKRHASIINEFFPLVKVVALRHSGCKKTDLDMFGLYDCVTSIEEAIAYKPQAAIISNPASKHIEAAIKLAEVGVNLLIEKPISDSVKGVKELIKLCHQNNCILMVAYNLRFLPSLIEFKEQIKSNKIGKILSIRSEVGQYLPSWRPELDYRDSVSANKDLGGGVLLELSHDIDYISWIFGPIKWVQSYISKQSSLEIDVEDFANILLGFDNNELTASLNMDFFRHDTTRKCFAIGEKGTLMWDGVNNEVKYFAKGERNWEIIFSSNIDKNYTYLKEIKSLFSAVEAQSSSSINGNDAMQVVVAIEAIKRSSEISTKIYL